MQNSVRPAGALLPPDLESDEIWKEALKMAIGVQLRSVVDEARQKLSDELAERTNDPTERQRLTPEHLKALQTVRQPGEGQFYPTPERELQERLWTSGAQTEHAQPGGMMKEQTTILERAKRVRKNKTPSMSLRFDAPRSPPPPFSPSSPHPPPPQYKFRPDVRTSEGSTATALKSLRKAEQDPRMPNQMTNPKRDAGPRLSDPVSYERVEYPTPPHGTPLFQSIHDVHSGLIAPMGSWKAPSVPDTEKSILEFSKPSPMFDELKPMLRSPIPATPPNPTCKDGFQRKPSIATGSIVQELWKPSITREEDMQMLRTSRPVKQRNTATSSVRLPSIPSVVSTDSLDVLSSDVDRELVRTPYTDHERIGLDRAQEKDGGRKRPVHVVHLVQNNNQRLGDHGGLFRPSTTPPSSATYPRSRNDSDVHPIAQRPWKPSVMHEDMHISRTFRFATRDGSASATTSSSTFRITFADTLNERPVNRYTDDRLVPDSNQRLKDRFGSSPFSVSSPRLTMYPWPGNSFHLDTAEVRLKKGEARLQEDDGRSRELEVRRREEVEEREKEVNSREMMIIQKEEYALQKEEEAQRRMEEAILKAQEMQRKEEELRRREDELNRKEDLGSREAEMRWDHARLREEHWKWKEETSNQSAEEGEKQGVLGNSPLETLQPIPSPQMPGSSGPLPIANHNFERGGFAAVNLPTDQVGVSAASGNDPTSSWLSTSARPTPTTSVQPPNTPKSSGPAIPTSNPPISLIANAPLTKIEFHRRQAEQAWQREDQSRREKARLAMQECERQANAGGVRSREKVTKLFEAHHNQWDKIQTFRTLIWEDFPWPLFKSPKGPEDLTSHAISDYMLSPIHPQDRVTKRRIKDDIRRWHRDQFSSTLLPKVEESERERILEGARSVVRILNSLLRSHS